MQVEGIKLNDYIKTEANEGVSYGVGTSGTAEKASEKQNTKELKALSVDNAYYNKRGNYADSADNQLKKDLTEAEEMGVSTMDQIANLESGWDEEATAKTEQDGLDPMNLETHTLVTVVDEIKMNIAKAGGDISKMGGLSDAEIEAMGELAPQTKIALNMTEGLDTVLSDETKAYLVKNELEPTINNIYNATYSAPERQEQQISDDEIVDLLTKLGDKLDSIIEELEVKTPESAEIIDEINTAPEQKISVDNPQEIKELCGKMLAQDIPITKENLEYMVELENYEKPAQEDIVRAIEDIVAEDKEPKDAYLIEGYSLMDQARDAVDQVQAINIDDLTDVQSKIQLTEVQLTMTVEATFVMLKNGVEVNTSDLSDLLDKLKSQENSLLEILMKDENPDKTNSNVSLYQDTMSEIAEINAAPLATFGRFSNIGDATLPEIREVSVSITAEYSRMEMTYEAVGTEVRKDLGDSMQKAFQNVDDILADLDIETTADNEKAVRALAYNEMPITKEAVVEMKSSIELVSQTFKSMTPAVVTEIIKRGENPLDMKLSELNQKANEIKLETGSDSETEGFAKFLWKAEHAGDISDEERESFIGVYRLLNQVDKTDGAAIGALINQGTEVTLRNLMTVTRSAKHVGKEYEINDKFGQLDEMVVSDLSITEQVEKVFLTNRCRDAKEAMTPEAMQNLGEDVYMDMDPDEFATAMEMSPIRDTDKEHNEYMTEQLLKALDTNQDVIDALDTADIPTTPNMIQAMQALMENDSKMMKDLYGKYADQEDLDIDFLIEEAYERFAEACSTPEEMAEAEEALGILAENVMRTMITTEDVNTIELDDMKLVVQQAKCVGMMAANNETYHIPMMIADEAGNMNLKIVRGTGESGLIKMALYMESTGTISSTFKYEDGQVEGTINCETAQMRDEFAQRAPIIAQTMQEETGYGFSFSFGESRSTDVSELYNRETGNFQQTEDRDNEIQTEALYGIARGFIRVMGEMFS